MTDTAPETPPPSWLLTAIRRAEMGRGDFTDEELEALRSALRALDANLADARAALSLMPKGPDAVRDYVDNIRFNTERVLARRAEQTAGEVNDEHS